MPNPYQILYPFNFTTSDEIPPAKILEIGLVVPGIPNLLVRTANSQSLSIGFGPHHYCGNRDPELGSRVDYDKLELSELWQSTSTVELFAFGVQQPGGYSLSKVPGMPISNDDFVYGWVSKDLLAGVIKWITENK